MEGGGKESGAVVRGCRAFPGIVSDERKRKNEKGREKEREREREAEEEREGRRKK